MFWTKKEPPKPTKPLTDLELVSKFHALCDTMLLATCDEYIWEYKKLLTEIYMRKIKLSFPLLVKTPSEVSKKVK